MVETRHKIAAAYCRVSTDKTDQLNSLAAQEEFFREYAIKNGYILAKTYSDEGISGTKTKNRLAFLQMIIDAQEGKFDYLLVKDVSRFARNAVDSLANMRKLTSCIQKIIFINNPNITDNEFLFGLVSLMAQEESVNMSKRVKFGKRINAEKGKVPNQVFGYDKIPGEYFDLLINEKEANVVRMIFHYYVNEGYGCNTIAKMLNEQGLITKRGSRWEQTTVARILVNELYMGQVINGKQEMISIYTYDRKEKPKEEWLVMDRPDLALVSKEIFEEAQKLLSSRYDAFNINRERSSNKHIFSTLIKCGECGSSFRRLPARDALKTFKWTCNNRNYHGADVCSNVCKISETELLVGIKQYLCDAYKNKTNLIKLTREEFKKLYRQSVAEGRSIKSLEKEREQLKATYERQLTLCEKGLISYDEFEKRSKEVKERILQLEYDIKYTENVVDVEEMLYELLNNLFGDIEKLLQEDIFTNQLLKKIIDYIEVFPDGKVKIYMKILSNVHGKLDVNVPNYNNRT